MATDVSRTLIVTPLAPARNEETSTAPNQVRLSEVSDKHDKHAKLESSRHVIPMREMNVSMYFTMFFFSPPRLPSTALFFVGRHGRQFLQGDARPYVHPEITES
jgi:hypothetical protein